MNLSVAVHPPPGRHDAADDRHRAGRRAGVLASCRSRRCRRWISRRSRCRPALPGASPETMASAVATPLERQFGRIAGVTEMTSTSYLGIDVDHAAVRPEPQHRRRRPRRAGRHQRRPRPAAGQPAEQSDLPQGQSGRCADPDPRAHLRHLRHARRCTTSASSILQQKLSQVRRRRAGDRRRRRAAGRARRGQSDAAQQPRPGPGRRAHRARPAPTPTAPRARSPTTTAPGRIGDHRSAAQGRRVPAADRRLPQRRAGAACATSPTSPIRSRTSAPPAWPTASPPILLIIFRQPGANIIETVDRVRALLPQLQAEIPAGMQAGGRRWTARRPSAPSVHDVRVHAAASRSALVILVVFVFLRNVRATLIPSVAVPVSLIGTFGVMYLCGYSLDNLSLMALTIATGFVVDDAIVVIENITRHLEAGHDADAGGAARGARRSASPSSRSASRWSRCSSRSC